MTPMVYQRTLRLSPLLLLLAFASCGKRYVECTITNNSGMELHAVELDYPGGSFGTNTLLPGQTFRYRFKALNNGALKLHFEAPQHAAKESSGPPWQENHSGTVNVAIGPESNVHWAASN